MSTKELVDGEMRAKHEHLLLDEIHDLCESNYWDYSKLLRIRSAILEKFGIDKRDEYDKKFRIKRND